MVWKLWSCLPAALLVGVGLIGCGPVGDRPSGEAPEAAPLSGEEATFARLRELQAEVMVEASSKGERVVSIDLSLVAELREAMELVIALPRVDRLSLHSSHATAAEFRSLVKLPSLRNLDLSQTAITDDDLRVVESLPELEFLILWSTEIGDRGLASIAKLQRLRKLDLSHTRVTRAGLSQLGELKRLEELLLEIPSISADDIQSLQANLKGTLIVH